MFKSSRMTGTIGAAAKVETKEMKNPSQDMWKDMWCGRWNEKMFKDIALCSLFYFSSKEKEGKKRDGEYSSKKSISKNESVRLRARVGSAPIRRPTLRPIEMERRKKRFRALLIHLSRRIIFGTDATTGASLAPQMPSKGRENNI
tara:strand:- start:11 stop:445 length:435 start_codon:yes stop_codon:yes gene_type:complete